MLLAEQFPESVWLSVFETEQSKHPGTYRRRQQMKPDSLPEFIIISLILACLAVILIYLSSREPVNLEKLRERERQILTENLGPGWEEARTGSLVKHEDGKILVFKDVISQHQIRLYHMRERFAREYGFDQLAGATLIVDDGSEEFRETLLELHRQIYGTSQQAE